MILADKIIALRKKNGWSQEDLAQQMNVSRQSISKWESAQSIPDLGKIIRMSELFGVSTDYLLKDEMNQEEYVETENPHSDPLRRVSLHEANDFLVVNQRYASILSIGVSLCIVSLIPLLLLSTAASSHMISVSEDQGSIFGLILSLLILAAGIVRIVSGSQSMEAYQYLRKEGIDTEYGVSGMAESKKSEFQDAYHKRHTLGLVLCVVSLIPLFLASAFSEQDFYLILGFCGVLILVSIGVYQFVYSQTIMDGYNQLLEVKNFDRQHKVEEKETERNPLIKIYWSFVVAAYIVISFLTGAWGITWLIWIVAWPIELFVKFISKK